MAHIVVLGAGLGGVMMAFELKPQLRAGDRLTVINKGPTYSFVPSNPWAAVGWRERKDIEVDLAQSFGRHGIALAPQGAKRVVPADNRIELNDGSSLTYDFLVIATGPDLAFDEIEGFGPDANTSSICQIDHALQARERFEALVKNPGRW